MNSNLYWIWLSKIKISAISKKRLMEKYKVPANIWNLKEIELNEIVSSSEVKEVLNPKYRQNLEGEWEFIKKYNIQIVNYLHKYYPENLKNIYDMPVVFYAIGNLERLRKKSVAIVGARQCSEYGRHVARELAKNIAGNNVNVVSGLAIGIDSEAHIGAGGNTIAVLGSGINVIYPNDNIGLAKDIIRKGGVIISEYPIGEKPERLNFPNRNRLISGLAEAVIVVEAGERSGSLITADFALEQGKEVYAVPGNITSTTSAGTNQLIYDGAVPIVSLKCFIGDVSF